MTLLQRALAHYVDIAQRGPAQKLAAWQCAQALAEMDPYQLAELPKLLTQTMRQKSQEQKTGD